MIAKALIAQTVGTIVAAVLTYFFGSTLTAELSAASARTARGNQSSTMAISKQNSFFIS